MSYNLSVKESLLDKKQNKCCVRTELFSYLCFGKSYFDGDILITEADKNIFLYFKKLLENYLNKELPFNKTTRFYELKLGHDESDYIIGRLVDLENALLNKSGFINKKCCLRAFARGMFLSKGIVSDPLKRYSLEFIVDNDYLSKICYDYLVFIGFKPGISKRNGSNVIYIKNKEGIKDFLYYIGAVDHMFEYTNTEIKKDLQNKINRVMNCENANIDKSVNALALQRKKIKRLKLKKYKGLSDELIKIAEKRLESDAIDIESFGKEFDPPYPKSTIYRKLKIICDLSDKLNGDIK